MQGDSLKLQPALDPHMVERFRAGLERLTAELPRPLGVAVSGGNDSLALLLLAHSAYPGNVCAATVDHGLRAEAATEAAFVARLCVRMNVPHTTLRSGPKRRNTVSNLQEQARLTRYQLLDEWARQQDLSLVATAHHRDDVAETFLMRASRGAGVRSLAAMPPARTLQFSTVLLVRPLLEWSRAELAEIVRAAAIQPVLDPSNGDTRFHRARLRTLLANTAELPPERLARTATNLRDVEEALEWFMQRELLARFEGQGDGVTVLFASDLPFELKRRFVLRAVEEVRQANGLFKEWRETAVPALIRALDAGRGGTVADVQARAVQGRWQFRLAPPRRTG